MNFTIRKWLDSDKKALAKYLNNILIWNNCRDSLPHPYTETDAEQFIRFVSSQEQQHNFCIEVNGEAAGNISFERGKDVERFNAEICYWLAEPYWNQGIMSRALKEVVNSYFTNSDVVRLFANVYESNTISMQVLEKVGFRKAGIHHKACFKNGQFIDCYYYELLKSPLV